MNRIFISIAVALLAIAPPAFGQAGREVWPAKPVRVIIPYPPGGGAEAAARFLANHFTQAFGQSFVIDNRPGGNTVIGAEAAAKAPRRRLHAVFHRRLDHVVAAAGVRRQAAVRSARRFRAGHAWCRTSRSSCWCPRRCR